MKLETIVQAGGKEMNITKLEDEVSERVKAAGVKMTAATKVKAYVNVDEGKTYIVVKSGKKEIALD